MFSLTSSLNSSACCVCDSESSCIVVTLYRLAQGYGVTIGDSIVIPEPCLKAVSVNFNGEVRII